MKEFKIFNLCFFLLFVFELKSGYCQTVYEWEKIHTTAKKIISTFPTLSQITNSKLPQKSKQWLLDTRKSIAFISDNKIQPDKEITRQLFSKAASIPKGFQENILTMLADNNSGSGQSSADDCLTQYNKCMKDSNCEYDSWLCACCVPCSLEYAGCMKDIIFIAVTTDIKTKAAGTATPNK